MQQNTDTTGAMAGVFAAYGLFMALLFLGIIVLSLVINWKIASKAGYEGAMSLLMLIPLVNIIIVLLFAFSEWPIERRLKALTGGTTTSLPPSA